jgi:ankyrin repeat protein
MTRVSLLLDGTGIPKMTMLTLSGDLVIHAAVMASPSKRNVEFFSYLVKTYPALLETKSVEQLTPLMLAYKMGRFAFAKILIEAGAEQTPKDSSWKNLLHLALQETPRVDEFKPMLELLDKDHVLRMIKERDSLDHGGRTPLHQWIVCFPLSEMKALG